MYNKEFISAHYSNNMADSPATQDIDAAAQKQQEIAEMYCGRYEEMDRRSKVVEAAKLAKAEELPILDSLQVNAVPSQGNYKYVMFNKTHVGLNPHGKSPGVRVLGLFRERADAMAHLNDLSRAGVTADELGDIHLAPRMKWVLIPKSKDRDRDEKYTMSKIKELVDLQLKERRLANEEFEKSKSDQSVGATGVSLEKQRQRQQGLAKKHHKKSARLAAISTAVKKMEAKVSSDSSLSVAAVPRSAELRKQNHVVIASIKDYTPPVMKLKDVAEPAVLFIDVFDNPEDAQKCIVQILSKYIKIMNMDMVDLYEWIFPEDMDSDKLPPEAEMWRDEEQTKIMRHHKTKTSASTEYMKQQVIQHSADPTVTEVVANADTAESMYQGESMIPDQ